MHRQGDTKNDTNKCKVYRKKPDAAVVVYYKLYCLVLMAMVLVLYFPRRHPIYGRWLLMRSLRCGRHFSFFFLLFSLTFLFAIVTSDGKTNNFHRYEIISFSRPNFESWMTRWKCSYNHNLFQLGSLIVFCFISFY